MRSAFIGAAMLAFGLAVGLSVSSTRHQPPAVVSEHSAESWSQYQQYRERQEREGAEATARWRKALRDTTSDQAARERRAYEQGQIDGEGYAEDQARSR